MFQKNIVKEMSMNEFLKDHQRHKINFNLKNGVSCNDYGVNLKDVKFIKCETCNEILLTTLPVFEQAYNKLIDIGFVLTKFKDGPILKGPSVLMCQPLNALSRDNMTVYFYDLPEFYVKDADNEYEVSLFMFNEFENFYNSLIMQK